MDGLFWEQQISRWNVSFITDYLSNIILSVKQERRSKLQILQMKNQVSKFWKKWPKKKKLLTKIKTVISVTQDQEQLWCNKVKTLQTIKICFNASYQKFLSFLLKRKIINTKMSTWNNLIPHSLTSSFSLMKVQICMFLIFNIFWKFLSEKQELHLNIWYNNCLACDFLHQCHEIFSVTLVKFMLCSFAVIFAFA